MAWLWLRRGISRGLLLTWAVCGEGNTSAATNEGAQFLTLSALPTNATPLPALSGRLFAGPAHWAVESGVAIGMFGGRVAAGDFKAAGHPQLAVSMMRFRVRGRPVGKVWVFSFAAAGSVPVLDSQWLGSLVSEHSGEHLAAGDINGDGIADLLVGVAKVSDAQPKIGMARLFQGSATGMVWSSAWDNLRKDSSAPALKMTVADLNRDGFADAVIASAKEDQKSGRGGGVWLYAGSSNGLSAEAIWSAPDPGERVGFGVALTTGDVNGDGWPDLLIGTPRDGDGTVSLFHGSPDGLPAQPNLVLAGLVESAAFGGAVAVVGDLNGDGCQEIAVGAPGDSKQRQWPGEVFLHYGSPTGLVREAAWRAHGWKAGAAFGESVAGVGDVNGDGIPDLLVGAPGGLRDAAMSGRASLWLGRRNGFSAQPDWEVMADLNHTLLGAVVSGAGDLDGDGLDDFVITSHKQPAPGRIGPAGRMDVFRGLRQGYRAGENFPADGVVCRAGNYTADMMALLAEKALMSATNTAAVTERALAEGLRKRRQQYWITGSAAAVLGVTAFWLWRSRRRVRREAVQHERERLARDLHDGLGCGVHRLQRLTELLNQAGENSPLAQQHRDELIKLAQALSGSMDRLIWSVQPENDTLENLVTFLADYAPGVLQSNGIACELDLPPLLPPLPLRGDTRQQVFLAVNEALHNVVKHSQARQAWLRVTWTEPWLKIVVEDDGGGFASSSPRPGGGNGLKNLRERSAALQGDVELADRDGGGTRLTLRWPLPL